MRENAVIAGVGMVPFATPSKSAAYDVLAEGAARAALADAGIDLATVQQVYAGYVLHTGYLKYGNLSVGDEVICEYDEV